MIIQLNVLKQESENLSIYILNIVQNGGKDSETNKEWNAILGILTLFFVVSPIWELLTGIISLLTMFLNNSVYLFNSFFLNLSISTILLRWHIDCIFWMAILWRQQLLPDCSFENSKSLLIVFFGNLID